MPNVDLVRARLRKCVLLLAILLASLLAPLCASAAAATLTSCWDGTWATGSCPPQVSAIGWTATSGETATLTYTVAGSATKAYVYVSPAPCVTPAISVMRSGAGATYYSASANFANGVQTNSVTGLTANSEWCPYVLAEKGKWPPNNTLASERARYSVSGGNRFTPNILPGAAHKWNPGQYVAMAGSQGSPNLTRRIAFYNSADFANQSAIKGAAVYVFWGEMEAVKNTYDLSLARTEFNAIAAHGKRTIIRIYDKNEGNTRCLNRTYFPQWLYDQGGTATTQSDGRCFPRFWDTATRDRYILLIQAIAKEFESEPLFEGIVVTRETGVGAVDENQGYTQDLFITANKQISEAAQKAFPTSNVVLYSNYIPTATGGYGTTDAQKRNLWQWHYTSGVAIGSPDVAPDCPQRDLTCSGSPRFNDPQTGGAGQSGPDDEYNVTAGNAGADLDGAGPLSAVTRLSGHVAVMWTVELSEMGLNVVGQRPTSAACNATAPGGTCASGYCADPINDFAQDYLHANHLIWKVNGDASKNMAQYYGVACQGWNTTGGQLETIIADPIMPSVTCPTAYAAGCVTGGT